MFCPIIQAGIMLTGVTLKTHGAQSYSEDFNRFSNYKNAVCMKEDCEWYGHGCPAYPTNNIKAIVKRRILKKNA